MRIERLEIRRCRLPLVRFFETSFGRTYDRTFVLVKLEGGGAEGWGEAVAEAHPYYSAETTETTWHIVSTYLAPLVIGVEFAHPSEVFPAMARVRGHHMAKAAVEMAAWDLFARQQGQPLSQLLGGTRPRIASGVSVGIQDGVDDLLARIDGELADGYQRVKIKIKPGWDIGIVEAVRARFPTINLMVDANAAYTLDDAAHLAQLDPFELMMIEQPLDYDDVSDHAALAQVVRTPICLDESIHSLRSARDAIAAGACRVINVKPGRLGGHRESLRVHDLCVAHHVPVWHGGMLESGIGRAHNLHLASLPGFSLPGDVAASRRYYEPDLIDPPIEVAADGTIGVPDGPGLGVHIVAERVERATERVLRLDHSSVTA